MVQALDGYGVTGKRRWTVLIVLFVFVMAIFSSTTVYAGGACRECFEKIQWQRPVEDDIEARRILNENSRIASRQFEAMYAGFEGDRMAGTIIYPDFYGGSYVGYQGHVHVLIVESMYENARAHPSFGALLDEGVSFSFVAMPLSQLQEAQMAIGDIIWEGDLAERSAYARNVSGLGSCMFCSTVTVFIDVYSERMISGFRQHVYDSPMITFEQMGFMCLGGGQGSMIPFFVLMTIAVSLVLVIVISAVRAGKNAREQKRMALAASNEWKEKNKTESGD
ncbi:MAG: hypothetical protein FWE42_05585 [Defluviitaleaceae bacterium]|nr:hypothetical protein [Defluviitaleaceae bacterium]